MMNSCILSRAQIQTELLESKHDVHPKGPADTLNAKTFAGQDRPVSADIRWTSERALAAADEVGNHLQFRACGRRAEHRSAAGVADFEIAGDETGAEHLIVTHQHHLRAHSIFAEEVQVLGDPQRARRADSGSDRRSRPGWRGAPRPSPGIVIRTAPMIETMMPSRVTADSVDNYFAGSHVPAPPCVIGLATRWKPSLHIKLAAGCKA